MTDITLPWAPRALWPNGRAHFRVKAAAARTQKHEAGLLARAAGLRASEGKAVLAFIFCGPTRTSRYDLDGAFSSQKSAIDGIAAVLGIDDSLFSFRLERGPKGGLGAQGGVVVSVTVLPTA